MKLKNLIALLFISTTILLSSCKKDKENPSYYVKFKMNGNWVTWTKVFGELGPDLADDSKTNFGLTANDETLKTVFDISVQVDGPQLGTGTYNDENYFLPIMYMTDAGGTNMTAYTNSGYIDGKPEPKYTLTLTSITDKTISGKFTGNLLIDDYSEKLVEITEGEFVVPRIR